MTNHFLHTLQRLRESEELVLYDRIAAVSEEALAETVGWLLGEWRDECLAYPSNPPAFDKTAASWSALTVYAAAQLLLNRGHVATEAAKLFPPFTGTIDAGAVLSADLLLRFLPDLLRQMALIDPEDPLQEPLEQQLLSFHYSGVGYPLPQEGLDWKAVAQDRCLRQLYTDRVIQLRDGSFAQQPALIGSIEASLGMHAAQLWPGWKKES